MTTSPALFVNANSVMINVLVFGLPVLFIGFILFVIYYARRVSKNRDKARLAAAPILAEWDYSAAEWAALALSSGLSDSPKGPAHVTIKGAAITVTDESGTTIKDLSGFRRYVTDCSYEKGSFQIRVRAYPLTGTPPLDFTVTDFTLPVPPLASASAASAAAIFKAYIAEEPEKDVDTLPNYSLPHEALTAAALPRRYVRVDTGRLLIWAVYFALAGAGYFVVAAEIFTGDIPTKSGHASKPAAASPTFFWIFMAVETGLVLYMLGRGLYCRYKLERSGDIAKPTGFITQRTANIVLAVFLAGESLLALMLPIGEWVQGKAFGGYLFANHLRVDDAEWYWRLIGWHAAAGLAPLFFAIILIVFQPPRIWQNGDMGTFGVN
ncbi:MAG: hypothetical protein ABJA02_16070 [Acidobacteriota bacterium]